MEERVLKVKFLETTNEINQNFLGKGVQNKKTSVRRVWIFSGTAHTLLGLISIIHTCTKLYIKLLILEGGEWGGGGHFYYPIQSKLETESTHLE